MFFENGYIGKQGDDKVNSLQFSFPFTIGDRPFSKYETKRLWCRTEHKTFYKNLDDNNLVVIDKDLTTGTSIDISVQLMIGEAVLWGSEINRFFFKPLKNDNTNFENLFNNMITALWEFYGRYEKGGVTNGG